MKRALSPGKPCMSMVEHPLWTRCFPWIFSGAEGQQGMMWGGGAHVRTVLSMGTLVATWYNSRIKAFYARLLAAGKVKKVALTACMHKFLTILNAMLKHRTPWHAQAVQG